MNYFQLTLYVLSVLVGLLFSVLPVEIYTIYLNSLLPFVFTPDTKKTIKKVSKLFPKTESKEMSLLSPLNVGITLGLFANRLPYYLAHRFVLTPAQLRPLWGWGILNKLSLELCFQMVT